MLAAVAAALIVLVPGALGAINTTDDPGYLGAAACANGSHVNCNLYASKTDVFLSGSPSATDAGTYFFAVLDPGGPINANDGQAGNLSDGLNGDWTTREFSVATDGTITNNGSHNFDAAANAGLGELQVAPFDDTSNNGGVYIIAVCKIDPATYNPLTSPVGGSDCKRDAFKVGSGAPCTSNCTGVAGDLSASKTASPAFTRSFTWNIAKTVDKASITQTNGSPTATFNYTVTVNPLSHSDGSYVVTGDITVTNPNTDDVTGVDVTDAIAGEGNICIVSDGSVDGNPPLTIDHTNATIPGGPGSAVFPYTCTYTGTPLSTSETNTPTISWPLQFLTDDGVLAANSVPGTSASIDWTTVTPGLSDDCINVTDSLYGSLHSGAALSTGVCTDYLSDLLGTGTLGTGVTSVLNPLTGPPFTSLDLKYSNTVLAPTLGTCTQVNNTAAFKTDDTGATGSAGPVTVTVCNYNAPATLGYWGNHMYKCGTKEKTGTNGCNTQGPFTDSFLGHSVCTGADTCTVGTLGNYTATGTPGSPSTTSQVFNANNCSNASTSDSNAAGCLAAQLLAAELNVANLANPCSCDTIHAANVFLSAVGYNGAGSKVTFTGIYTRAYAIALKTALDNYNNGKGCPSV